MSDLTAWLTGPDKPSGVSQAWSPTYGDEQTKASLTSQDKQVALVGRRQVGMAPSEYRQTLRSPSPV